MGGEGPALSRERHSHGLGFAEAFALLGGAGDANLPEGRVALLVTDAAAARSESVDSARSISRRVGGVMRFRLDFRIET